METEMIDKLFLELSQVTCAKTKRELEMEDVLSSVLHIANRKGKDVNWDRLENRIIKLSGSISKATAKTFRILEDD